ncbi:protein of unknown function [Methylorubrum extorquens]|uniref:Uncharacterized protein n=1 Tax=Methylorubrum extorquens TaxID=408 RepID=A0A2N9AKC8_METEX|nr:protein of unknown function [Methylorubrum extorquens]
MEGGERPDLAAVAEAIRVEASARLEDAVLGAGQRLRRGRAETDEDVGVGEFDLALDEGAADRDLLRGRVAVARRAPGHDVGDVGARPVETDRRHHPVEELAGASHERLADPVLVGPRCLADEHHPRLRIAVGEDEVLGSEAQAAALEAAQQLFQFVEGLHLRGPCPRIVRRLAGLGAGRVAIGTGGLARGRVAARQLTPERQGRLFRGGGVTLRRLAARWKGLAARFERLTAWFKGLAARFKGLAARGRLGLRGGVSSNGLGLGEAVVGLLVEDRVDACRDMEVEEGDQVASGVGIRVVCRHRFHVAWERPVDNARMRPADRRTCALRMPLASPCACLPLPERPCLLTLESLERHLDNESSRSGARCPNGRRRNEDGAARTRRHGFRRGDRRRGTRRPRRRDPPQAALRGEG